MNAPLMTDVTVRAEGLTKRYGPQYAIRDVGFELRQGEIVGFLGPNGAGKSTTMKIMTSYILPDEGKCEVSGVSVLESPRAARRQVGYLPESNPLYPDLYVREYLDIMGQLAGLPAASRKPRIEETIEMVGLEAEQHKKIGQLSRGYRQRVGLARVLLHNPSILILDEPTSGLDPNQVLQIRALIRRLGKNRTIIFSSHHLDEVEAISTRILIIHHGRIVADAPADRLSALMGEETVVYVVFAREVSESFFQRVKGVRRVEPHGKGWHLYCEPGHSIEEDVFFSAAAANVPIVTLYRKQQELSEIFQRLTQRPSETASSPI